MGRRERGVHVGRDGWLFWLGDHGQLADLYADDALARWRLLRWRALIAQRRARAARMGARFVQVIAPDKLTIRADKLARPLIDPALAFARRLASAPGVLDLTSALDVEGAYLKTDTHWSHAGYLAAYGAICAELSAAPAPQVVEAPCLQTAPHSFDLGSKLSPPVTEPYAFHDFLRTAVRREANALVAYRDREAAQGLMPGMLTGSRLVLEHTAPGVDPRRIVLFGDSYAFHATGLAAMLGETFAEVHAVWSASMDWAYVERVRPDVVVCQLAERFLRRVPLDRFGADALAERRVRRRSGP